MTTTLDVLIIGMLQSLSLYIPPVLLYLRQTDKQVKGSLLLHSLSLTVKFFAMEIVETIVLLVLRKT